MKQHKSNAASPPATPATADKQRLETFAASLLRLETPRISKEIDEHIASVLNGAVEELQWIADELENGGL